MENPLNHYDKEHMKMAMLKHEETFRHQVGELHRLYRIQKKLMNNVNPENLKKHAANPNHYPDPAKPVREFNSRVSDIGDDLELTLGTRSYNHKKIKSASPDHHPPNELPCDSGTTFSNSSSTGSSHMNGKRKDELTIPRQKWAAPVKNQDILNSPPWLVQALSLNLT